MVGGELFLCKLADIENPGSKGFETIPDQPPFFVVRIDQSVFGYLNVCPHYGAPLDWKPDAFLSFDRDQILCSMHGALFDIRNGACNSGPCPGEALTRVELVVREDAVFLVR